MTEMTSKLQLKFHKLVLWLRHSTSTLMVHGEFVKFWLNVDCYFFWLKLLDNDDKTNLSSILYTSLVYLSQRYQSSYIKCVKNLLEEIGMSGF